MTAGSAAAGAPRRREIGLDLLVAVGVALTLSIGWAVNDWSRLSHMLLPDPDDMMRLAQVRDWLGGQGTNDWTQYRMAPPTGAPMHWSRVNDAGIAGLILAATPFVGRFAAEMVAVLAYPALLFACALFLSACIGRRLWGASGGAVAAILTGVAAPGTTIFVPGRIDHHALQVVLIQLLVLALMRAPTLASGAIAGLATAISLVVGLETLPQLAASIAVLAWFWLVRGTPERSRVAGFAAASALITAVFLLFLRPTLWTPAYCDAFTPASSSGTLFVAAAFGILAALTPRLGTWRLRLAAGVLLGGLAIGATAILFPSCINGPYGVVDPFLRRAYIPFIYEASSVFAQPSIARTLAVGGLVATGAVTGLLLLARGGQHRAGLLPVVAVVVTSALIMVFQLRGTYIGAPLSAPVLAGLIVAARQRTTWRTPAVIAAWLVSAGMAWVGIAQSIEHALSRGPATVDTAPLQAVCSTGDVWGQVDRLPPGVTMASTNVAAYIIGATHLSTVGAGYHRNNAGNMAMYRFFLSSPERSRAIGRHWNTSYVAFCPGDFDEVQVDRDYPHSLAVALKANRPPAWLAPLPLHGTPLRLYRVRQ